MCINTHIIIIVHITQVSQRQSNVWVPFKTNKPNEVLRTYFLISELYVFIIIIIFTYTHTLSLSRSHTHTHTHTQQGNPLYASLVHEELLSLFKGRDRFSCKRTAAQTLRQLLNVGANSGQHRDVSFQPDARYVDVTIGLFLLNDLKVHYEGNLSIHTHTHTHTFFGFLFCFVCVCVCVCVFVC